MNERYAWRNNVFRQDILKEVDKLPMESVVVALAEECSRSCIIRRSYVINMKIQRALGDYSADKKSVANIGRLKALYGECLDRNLVKIRTSDSNPLDWRLNIISNSNNEELLRSLL